MGFKHRRLSTHKVPGNEAPGLVLSYNSFGQESHTVQESWLSLKRRLRGWKFLAGVPLLSLKLCSFDKKFFVSAVDRFLRLYLT